MGVSHIVVKKGGIWEGCADSGRVAYRYLKGRGIFREGGVDSEGVA